MLTVSLLSWVTWAIHSHCSLKKRKRANRSVSFNLQKNFKKVQKIWFYSNLLSELLFFVRETVIVWFTQKKGNSLFYCEWPEWMAHSNSFVMSDMSNSLSFTLLSGATGAICSQSLICPEWFEPIAQSCSLKWAILIKWANSLPWFKTM